MAVTGPLSGRKRLLEVKTETDRGTAVTADTSLLALARPMIQPATEEIMRRVATGGGGYSYSELGPRLGRLALQFEMRGNGASADFDAGIAAVLLACGTKVSAGVYTPADPTDQKCCSVHINVAGVRKVLYGCHGNAKLTFTPGRCVLCDVDLQGLWSAPTDQSDTTTPLVLAPPRFQSCTWTLDSASPRFNSMTFDLGNRVEPMYDATAAQGIRCFQTVDRQPVITIDPEMQLVAGYDWHGKMEALSQLALSLLVGSATYNKFTLAAPKAQIVSLQEADDDISRNQITLRLCENSGGDEWSLTPA